jgi:hypothetical protein
MDFGFIDQSKYHGDIGWAPALNSRHWTVEINGIVAGNTYFHGPFNVIIDTGDLDGMHLPQWALDEFFRIKPGSVWNEKWRTYAFSCSTKLPDLIFGIG